MAQVIKSAVDQLKNAGLTAKVVINLTPDNLDIQKVKTLQAELKQQGILAEIHINVGTGLPDSGTDGQEDKPAVSDSFTVVVKETKLNCRNFRKTDGAGKPIMNIVEPRVQMLFGTRFSVSSTHKAGSKDAGDGKVFATGNEVHYFVTDCPDNPKAVGLYVRAEDVSPV